LAVTSREVVRKLEARGARKVRQKGSHAFYRSACDRCSTVVPIHKGEDLGPGLLRAIQKDMASCYGERWLLG
jgi:predicted RNA binding protein YcfA (HicA-like mRNA interferase family)